MPKEVTERIIDSPFVRGSRVLGSGTSTPPAPGGGGGGGETYTAGDGITINASNVISVRRDSGGAVGLGGGSGLVVNYGNGLQIVSNALAVLRNPTNSGLTVDGAGVSVDLQTISGLTIDPTGLALDNSVAGNGLQIASKVLSIKRPAGSGLLVDSTGIYIDPLLAGAGLTYATGVMAVGAGAGLTASANAIAVNVKEGIEIDANFLRVDEDYAYAWAGIHTFAEDVTFNDPVIFNDNGTFNTGVFRFNTDPQLNSNLDFIGGVERFVTAASHLSLTPTGDLTLDPGGLIVLPNAQTLRTEAIQDTPVGILGLHHFDRGSNYRQLTIGALKADELYVRVFVADETRIDRGEEFWSKGFGVLETDSSPLPALHGTVDMYFENAVSFSGNIFSVGDWLLARVINFRGGGLVVQKIWFEVAAFVSAEGDPLNRQRWTLIRRNGGAANQRIIKGNVFLNMGASGQGAVHLSALEQDNGPFIQFGSWEGANPYATGAFTNYVRIGNLKGTVDYGGVDEWGIVAGKHIGLAPSAGFSGFAADADQGLRLFNTDILLYEDAVASMGILREEGIALLQDTDEDGHRIRQIGWYDDLGDLAAAPISHLFSYDSTVGSTPIRNFGIGVTASTAGEEAVLALTTLQQSPFQSAHLKIYSGVSGGFAPGGGIELLAKTTHVTGRLVVSESMGPTPASALHLAEDTTATGTSAGLTIEQEGTGDAVLQWLADSTRWVMGIDNSATDNPLRITYNADVGATPSMTFDINGFVYVHNTLRVGTTVGTTPASRLYVNKAVASGGTDERGASIVIGGGGTSTARVYTGLYVESIPSGTGAGSVREIGIHSKVRGLQSSGQPLNLLLESTSGDVAMTYSQLTSGQKYTMGIDNTDNYWKICIGPDLTGDPVFRIDPTTGNVIITGITVEGGGGSLHEPVSAGPGILVNSSQMVSVNPSYVALASTTIDGGDGLTGGGALSSSHTLAVGQGLGILVGLNDVGINPLLAGAGLGWLAGVISVGEGAGINVGVNDVSIDPNLAGGGLSYSAGIMAVNAGIGLEIDSGTDTVRVKLPTLSGLFRDSAGLIVLRRGAGTGTEGESGLALVADGLYLADSMAGAGLDWSTPTGRVLNIGAGAGIVVGVNDVSIDPLLAGAGLSFTAGVMAVNPGLGLEFSGDTLKVKLGGPGGLSSLLLDASGLSVLRRGPNNRINSGIAVDAADGGLYLNNEVAGNGLVSWVTSADRILNIGAGNGITVNSTNVAVDTTYNFPWTGAHSFNAGTTFNSTTTFNDPATFADFATFNATTTFNANLTLAADVSFSGLRTISSTSSNNLNINAGGDLVLNPGGQDVLPGGNVLVDLGDYNRKWRTLFATELYVETLVAQDVLATIGGRIMVAPTTTLIADVTAGATTIDVKHNNLPNGSFVMLQTAPGGIAQFEVMKTTSTHSSVTGGYRYSVTRNLDGTGANAWVAGDAVVNLGRVAGEGYIDLTSTSTIHNHLGPAMTIYSRTGTALWTDTVPVVSLGNLASFVDFPATTFGLAVGNDLTKDPTTGFSGFTATQSADPDYDGLRLFNTEINLYDGANRIISLSQEHGLILEYDDNVSTPDYAHWVVWYNDLENTVVAPLGGIGMNRALGSGTNILDVFAGAGGVPGDSGQVHFTASTYDDTLHMTLDTTYLNVRRAGGATHYALYLTNTGRLGVNVPTATTPASRPASILHVYESTTAVGATAGLTIEQASTGDAVVQFLAGAARWVMGIDNSVSGDPLRISPSADLSAAPVLTLTAAGALTVTGALTATGATISGAFSTTGSVYIGGQLTTELGIEDHGGFHTEASAEVDQNLTVDGISHLRGSIRAGVAGTPVSLLHMVENNALVGATAGLTIEQQGAGDALLQFVLSTTDTARWVLGIDNSAAGNPFVISASANLSAAPLLTLTTGGTLTAVGDLITHSTGSPANVIAIADGSLALLRTTSYRNSATAGVILFEQARGTEAVPLTSVNGDRVGGFFGYGYSQGSAAFLTAAGIGFFVDGVPGTGDMPGRIDFQTSPDGSATLATRLRINNAGDMGFGTTDIEGWDSAWVGINYGAAGSFMAHKTVENIWLMSNLYYDGAFKRRMASTQASGYNQQDGEHRFWVVPSGIADSSVASVMTQALTINVTGQVGIGETAPGAWLDVDGGLSTLQRYQASVINSSDVYAFVGRRANYSAGAASKVLSGMNLMTIAAQGYSSAWNSTISAQIGVVATEDYDSGPSGKGGADIAFWTKPNANASAIVRRMTISQSGRVGIGDAFPGAKLVIDNNLDESINSIWLNSHHTNNAPSLVGRAARGASGVGIATQNGDTLLFVGAQGRWDNINYGGMSASIKFAATQAFTDVAQGAEIQFSVIKNSVNPPAPQLALTIQNTGWLVAPLVYSNNTLVSTPTAARTLLIDANGLMGYATSALRYKQAIRELDERYGDDFILGLRPISYEQKNETTPVRQLGFIAEEVQELGATELVLTDADGTVQSLAYERFIVPLIATVQRLMRRVEELERRVAA